MSVPVLPPCSPVFVGALRPCTGDGNVASLIWRIPKVCSNRVSAAHSLSASADGKLTVPSGFVT